MHLSYGFVKCQLSGNPELKSKVQPNGETQYHLHASLNVAGEKWDTAINVGTDDSDDLLRYILVLDFQHVLTKKLRDADGGFQDLTGNQGLPALDFLRSDLLSHSGKWRDSDVMDGSELQEPVASLSRLLQRAFENNAHVYIYGRTYTHGGSGIHDIHMNQGSTSTRFLNNGVDNHNDHNDIWQDGAVLVDFGSDRWSGYFTAFTQQMVPTDNLGNPKANAHETGDQDIGSLIGH